MVFTAVVHVPVRVRVTLVFKVSRILTTTHQKALILRPLTPRSSPEGGGGGGAGGLKI